MHCLARQNPTHVRPQPPFARRVRITFPVGILVMDTMRRHPGDRPSLEGQGSAHSQEVFHPFRRLVASMREQPVIAHAYPKTSGNPQSRTARANAFQVKKNNARMAPTWNAPMKKLVVQLTGCANVLSRLRMLIVSYSSATLLPILPTNLARETPSFCNSYVISSRLVLKESAFKRNSEGF